MVPMAGTLCPNFGTCLGHSCGCMAWTIQRWFCMAKWCEQRIQLPSTLHGAWNDISLWRRSVCNLNLSFVCVCVRDRLYNGTSILIVMSFCCLCGKESFIFVSLYSPSPLYLLLPLIYLDLLLSFIWIYFYHFFKESDKQFEFFSQRIFSRSPWV